MAGSKRINLSRFFRQDSASPSGVGVRDELGAIPQAQVVMSGKDLSDILRIIQTTTDISTEQKEFIRVEDRNDDILQSLVNGLQQRIFGLQSSLFRLKSDFESYLSASKRLDKKKERQAYTQYAEVTKRETFASPSEGLISTYTPPSYSDRGDGEGGETSLVGAVAGGLIGTGGALLGNMLDDEDDSNYTPPPGKSYSLQQLKELALSVGFKGENADKAAAIAYAESTGNTQAHNDNYKRGGDDNSYGLWQINMIDEPGYMLGEERRKKFNLKSNEELWDPQVNARVAFALSGGSKFGAWTTFGGEKYKGALEQIKKLPTTAKGKPTEKPAGTSPQASATTEPASATVASLSTTNVEATQISTAPQTPAQIAEEEKSIMASQVKAQKGEKTKAETLSQSKGDMASAGPPIVIPVNNNQTPAGQDMQVSAGNAIPGGLTENRNNFYPSLSRAILGIMV